MTRETDEAPEEARLNRWEALGLALLLIAGATVEVAVMIQIPGVQRLFSADPVGDGGELLLISWFLATPTALVAAGYALGAVLRRSPDLLEKAYGIAIAALILFLIWLGALLLLASTIR